MKNATIFEKERDAVKYAMTVPWAVLSVADKWHIVPEKEIKYVNNYDTRVKSERPIKTVVIANDIVFGEIAYDIVKVHNKQVKANENPVNPRLVREEQKAITTLT